VQAAYDIAAPSRLRCVSLAKDDEEALRKVIEGS
jgi:hypothetical protein